jgi:hypothetical protein
MVLPLGSPHAASFKKEMAFAVDLAEKGLWNEAAHRFLNLLKQQPHNPRLWNDLAVAYEAIGEYDKAHEAYEEAVTLAAYPPDALLANQEAFESFYRTWQEPTVAEPPPLVDPRTAPPRPVKPTVPVFPGPDFDDDTEQNQTAPPPPIFPDDEADTTGDQDISAAEQPDPAPVETDRPAPVPAGADSPESSPEAEPESDPDAEEDEELADPYPTGDDPPAGDPPVDEPEDEPEPPA